MTKYADLVLKGENPNIDDYIDMWHDDVHASSESLHEFLGVTWDEYAQWLELKGEMHDIIRSRKNA